MTIVQIGNPEDLLTSSYDFELPEELIAQRPIDSKNRHDSKLLIYKLKSDEVIHDTFKNVAKYLPEKSTIVFNQSKVFPSRLIGTKLSGGKAEVFLLSAVPNEKSEYEVLIKARGKKKIGDEFLLPNDCLAKITKVLDNGTFMAIFNRLLDQEYLESFAKIPIPPYIRNGESDQQDVDDYQTKYAKVRGSVAASTAGLHFTEELLNDLEKNGFDKAFVTLHVGIGTFRPVSVDNIKEHQMHFEKFVVDNDNFLKIKKARPNIVAVGTTSMRTLQSMEKMEVFPGQFYETNIFLHPGVEVLGVSALITNFHLPKSSLIMLVSSLIGRQKALELYSIAIKNRYRFFSYGDAMLIVL